jgi:peptidoglycan hydrolase-like protein with peptidoglycan-binding domain
MPSFGSGTDTATTPSPWVSWAQTCLAQIVGDWVPQDGVMNPETRRAIGMFQSQQQLPATGSLDEQTLNALQAACGGADAGGSGGAPGGEGV